MSSDSAPRYQWAKSFPTPILSSSHKFSCKSCDRTFNRQCDLNRHIKYHTRPYKCDQCDMPFSSPKDRSRHLEAAHRKESDEILRYCCTERPCTETGGMIVRGQYTPRFRRKDNWKMHLRLKHNLRPQQIRQIEARGIPTAVFSATLGWHNGAVEQLTPGSRKYEASESVEKTEDSLAITDESLATSGKAKTDSPPLMMQQPHQTWLTSVFSASSPR